jgi:PRC-barrel domain
MLRNVRRFTPALVLCAAALAQSTAPAQPPPPRPTGADSQPGHRAKQVIGAKISIQGNVVIGTVDDIVFADDGHVEYLLVVNDGKLVTVPWAAATFNFEQRTAVVDIPVDRFKLIPTFTVDRYPTFLAPTYREEIYKHYGLRPRDFRPPPPPPPKKKP